MNFLLPILLILFGIVSYFSIDKQVVEAISDSFKSPLFFLKVQSLIFSPLLILLSSAFGLYFVRKKGRSLSLPFLDIFISQFIAFGAGSGLKVLLGRARPQLFLSHELFGFFGFSWNRSYHPFPSGHTLAAFTLAATLALHYPRFQFSFFLVAALISISRVISMSHFPSDILISTALAILIGKGVYTLRRRFIYETV